MNYLELLNLLAKMLWCLKAWHLNKELNWLFLEVTFTYVCGLKNPLAFGSFFQNERIYLSCCQRHLKDHDEKLTLGQFVLSVG